MQFRQHDNNRKTSSPSVQETNHCSQNLPLDVLFTYSCWENDGEKILIKTSLSFRNISEYSVFIYSQISHQLFGCAEKNDQFKCSNATTIIAPTQCRDGLPWLFQTVQIARSMLYITDLIGHYSLCCTMHISTPFCKNKNVKYSPSMSWVTQT